MITGSIIVNGVIKLVISATTEAETLLLRQIFQGPVECQHRDKVQIDDKNVSDAIVITAKGTNTQAS